MTKTGSLTLLGTGTSVVHDSSAALLADGKLVAAAEEERFSRIKHDASFPSHALRYCLAEAGSARSRAHRIRRKRVPLSELVRSTLPRSARAMAPTGADPVRPIRDPRWMDERTRRESACRAGSKEERR